MTTTPGQPQHEAAFFTSVRGWGITRGDHGVFGGVAEGVGERIGMDRVPARLVAVVLAIITSGLFLTAYAAAWAILPDRNGRIIAQDFGRGTPNVPALIGIAIFGLLGLNGLTWTGRPFGFGFLGVFVSTIVGLAIVFGIIGLIIWAVTRDGHGNRRVVVEIRGSDEARAQAEKIRVRAKVAGDDMKAAATAFATEARASGKRVRDEARSGARRAKVAADEIRAAVVSQPAVPPTDSTGSSGTTPLTPPVPPMPPIVISVPPRPRVPGPGKAIRLLAFAASLLSAAVIWFLDREGYLTVHPIDAWFAIAVIIVGFAIILAGAAGRRVGVFGFWAVVLVLGWSARIAAAPEVDRWLNSHDLFINFDGPPRLVSVNEGTVDCRAFDWTLVDEAADTRINASDSDYRVTLAKDNSTIVVPTGSDVTVRATSGDVSTTLSWKRVTPDTSSYYGTCDIDGPIATFSTVGNGGTAVTVIVASSVKNIVIEEN